MRARVIARAVAALAVAVAVSGCGRIVSGTAQPAGGSGTDVNTRFDKLLRECEVVSQEEIARTVGAVYARSSFNGAVCMWDLESAPGGNGMATLSWYEIGSLANEKQNNDRLGYLTRDITVQGRRALETHRPDDPDSCGVIAPAADQGVVGWWVNYRPNSTHPDPCAGARKLVEVTLNLAR